MSKFPSSEWVISRPLGILSKVADENEIDWPDFLKNYGLTAGEVQDQGSRLDVRTVIAAFDDLARLTGDDIAVLDVFYQAEVGYANFFDYVGFCAPTVRESLKNWARFFPTRTNSTSLSYSETDSHGILEWYIPDHLGVRCQFTYGMSAFMVGRIEQILAGDGTGVCTELAAPPPVRTSTFLAKYNGQITFDAPATRFLVPSSKLSNQPPDADQGLFRIVEEAAQLALEEGLPGNLSTVRIATVISERLKSGDCSLDEVAAELNVTPHQLQKELELTNTTFRQLVGTVRRSAAEHYLRETNIPVKELTYMLGFTEISAFSRAVKNWFGHPPRTIRNQAQQPETLSVVSKSQG